MDDDILGNRPNYTKKDGDDGLLAELHSFKGSTISLTKLQTERIILEVLQKVVLERDERGRNYSISKAISEAGISTMTWYNWVNNGYVDGPLRSVSKQVAQVAYDNILPFYQNIIQSIVSIAMGIVPEGSDIKRVQASEAISAFRQLSTIIPIEPLTANSSSRLTELEHAERYQPKQIQVNVNYGDFVYTGQDGDAKMGQMESIGPIEGEFEESED